MLVGKRTMIIKKANPFCLYVYSRSVFVCVSVCVNYWRMCKLLAYVCECSNVCASMHLDVFVEHFA